MTTGPMNLPGDSAALDALQGRIARTLHDALCSNPSQDGRCVPSELHHRQAAAVLDLMRRHGHAAVVGALPLSLPAAELAAALTSAEAEHGPGVRGGVHGGHLLLISPGEGNPLDCGCRRCQSELRDAVPTQSGWPLGLTTMAVCPDCGHKRCPRASWHVNACSGSNEPGQAGSVYA